MVNNLYALAGEAFASGAPIGASVNTAQVTRTPSQARAVGAAFGLGMNMSAGIPAATRAPLPAAPVTSFQRTAQAVDANVQSAAFSALHALNTPIRKVGDYIEANIRYGSSNIGPESSAADRARAAVAFFQLPFLWGSEEWRQDFEDANGANASPSQTLWLAAKSGFAPDEVAPSDDPYRILDNPAPTSAADEPFRTERDDYFGGGIARWATGFMDLAVNLTLDPLIVGGKATSVIRAARNGIKASDVAAAATKSANLTRGGRRIENMVDKMADAFERAPGDPGELAALTQARFLRQSTDGGAIAALQRRIDQIADPTVRMAARKDALYAGLGHKPSLLALEQADAKAALELEGFLSNRPQLIQDIVANMNIDHGTKLRLINDPEWVNRQLSAHADDLLAARDAYQRVGRVGNPAGLTAEQMAAGAIPRSELQVLPDFIHVGRTIHQGLGLPRIHVLFGRKVPQMLDLDADDFFDSFGSLVMRGSRNTFRVKSGVDDELRALLDEASITRGMANPAAARATRRDIVDRFNRTMQDRLVAKHSYGDPERAQQVRDVLDQIQQRRTAQMVHLDSRVQQAVEANSPQVGVLDDAHDIYVLATEDIKSQFARPTAGTQLQKLASVPDYMEVDRALARHLKDGVEGFFARGANGVWEATEEGMTVLSDLWKFGALFRPGYTVRNMVDNEARNLAMMDSMDLLHSMVKGSRNMYWNRSKMLRVDAERLAKIARAEARINEIDDFLRVGVDDTAAAAAKATALRAERAGLVSTISEAKAALGTRSRDVFLLEARIKAAREELSKMGPRSKMTAAQAIQARRLKNQIADMRKGLRSEYVLRGETVQAKHIGMDGDLPAFRDMADYERGFGGIDASGSVEGLLFTEANRGLTRLRSSRQWQTIGPSNPMFKDAYLDLINKRIRNDAAYTRIIAGAGDDVLRKWYLTDPEGAAIWKALESRWGNVDNLIAAQRQQVDLLLPTAEIRSMVMGGPITPGMIDDAFLKNARPLIPAEMMETAPENALRSVMGRFERGRAWYFKYAGEMPEEVLGRLPFYVARKQMHLERLWPRMDDGTRSVLYKTQLDELYKRADVLSRRDVAHYLFDTSSRSNLSAHLRFFSPFYNAWSDTMRKWMRIMGHNPTAAPIGLKAFTSFNSAMVVVDNDGNRIMANGDVLNADGETVRVSQDPTEGFIVFPMPKWLTSFTGGADDFKVAKSALNVTFQGEPFWLPSAGPLVGLPVNEVVRNSFPEAAGNPVIKYLLPFGIEPDGKDLALPTWVQNLRTLIQKENGDTRYAQTYGTLMAEMVNRIHRGEHEPMTERELINYADNATRNWWIMRFFSNWFGASAIPQSRMQFWTNEYRRMRRELGADADQAFLAKYPDYAEARISLSLNETGIAATDESWNTADKYRRDITTHKDWGWMYVGAANLAPGFDQGVYAQQQALGWRGSKDPIEAFKDTQVSAGWAEYTQVNDAIQGELERRVAAGGPKSISANEDLQSYRNKFLADLKRRNGQWADAFETSGSAQSVNALFRQAAMMVEDHPELADRSDFAALAEYLDVRQAVRQELAARGLSSLNSQGAEDLAEYWAGFTTQLVASDLGFEQMWRRGGLDRDTIPVVAADGVATADAGDAFINRTGG